MRKLIVFNNVTLDGYFVDQNGDLSWAYPGSQDAEFKALVEENAKSGGEMLFGRVTYEMMASYWPTPMALANDPVIADGMNKASKVVFSTTLDQPSWNNTRLVKGDIAAEVRRMKAELGDDLLIFGSGRIVAQLSQEGLIDEYQIMVHPIILGQGRTMFEGSTAKTSLTLTKTQTFGNGYVLLCYQPVK